MERPWLIVGRALRVVEPKKAKAGHAAAAAAAVHAGAGAQDVVVGLQEQLEQRVTEVDREAAAAAADEAAQAGHSAAEPDFNISVKAPPLITFLTAGISYPNPPSKPDKRPSIVASGPFCLLAQFSAAPPTGGRSSSFNPHESHLVLVRQFRYGSDGRIAASAERVPGRGDDIPKLVFYNVASVGLLCADDDRSYVIAELRVDTDSALLVCYRSVLGAWSTNRLDDPLPPEVNLFGDGKRVWIPYGAVALDSRVIWFDLSWGLLSLDFNLQRSEFRLEFSGLPPGRQLGPGRHDGIRSDRCITVSGRLLRYVEIIGRNDKAPEVSMWCRRRRVGGWDWVLNYRVHFEEIWNNGSYVATVLPREVPLLACVSPVDPNVIYFTLHKRIFGVHVPERRVVHVEPMEVDIEIANSGRFLVWNLRPDREVMIRHVSLDPDDKDQEPQDPKGKSKEGGRKSTSASRPRKSLRTK